MAATAGQHRGAGRDWLWLIPPIALGAFLRVFRLGSQLLLYDELHAPRTLVRLELSEILTSYLPSDNSIPLTALYKLLVAQGVALTELHLRLPSIVAGLLALAVIPLALWRRLGREAGLWAAWLVAISPALVFYSRVARSYMPAVLLVFVAAMAFEQWWRTGSRRSGAGYVLAAAGAVWLHLGAGPIIAAPLLWAAGAKAARPRAGRSVSGLVVLGFALAACLALFLAPAWESFTALVTEKSGSSGPSSAALGRVLLLQAGAAEPFAAVLFWAAGVFGLAVLLRRRPTFAGLVLVLVGANAVALLVTAPLGVSSPMILNRYLLVGLPFVIACAAAGLAEAWRVATAVRTALLRRAGRLAVLAAVSLLVLGGPLDDPRLLHSSFLTHDDFIDFYRPPPRMLSSELVPEFYRRLAVPPGDEAVIEAPSLPTWAWQTHLRIYQDVHRRRVFLAPLEPTFFRAELDFANYVEPEPEALAAAPARWLALHRKSDWELDRVDVNGVVSLPLEPGMRSFSQRSALELGGRLTGRWGPPDYVDDLLLVWDLERVRRDQAAVGRRRDSRLNTP